MDELNTILQFVVPCWIVNLSLNLIYVTKYYFPKVEQIDRPIDFGFNFFDDRRILGNSTTIIGIAVALLAGFLSGSLLVGILVYLGHALGSFIKRRLNYKDGDFMPVVDHGDYVILTGAVFLFLNKTTPQVFLLGLLLTYILHPVVTYASYLVKWHKKPL